MHLFRLLCFVPLALAVSCGTSAPSRYERGAPAPPPPAPLRPGHGAPVVGQPGAQRAPPPRSPHARQLPASEQPGVWSGDRPRAAGNFNFTPVQLLGVELPTPLEIPEEQLATTTCASSLDIWLHRDKLKASAEKLTLAERRCAAHALLVFCLSELKKDKAYSGPAKGADNALLSALWRRDDFCREKGANTKAVHALLNKYQVREEPE